MLHTCNSYVLWCLSQEVDEAKEGTSEVLQRVDDIKRHVSGLESKLEGFSQAMALAITPIHSTLTSHLERLEALQRTKQDAASAVLYKVSAGSKMCIF